MGFFFFAKKWLFCFEKFVAQQHGKTKGGERSE